MSCNDFDITIDNIIRLGEQKEEETINVIPTKESQVIYPTPNKTIGKVNVEPIPEEYITNLQSSLLNYKLVLREDNETYQLQIITKNLDNTKDIGVGFRVDNTKLYIMSDYRR